MKYKKYIKAKNEIHFLLGQFPSALASGSWPYNTGAAQNVRLVMLRPRQVLGKTTRRPAN